jgi:hypothetical protein
MRRVLGVAAAAFFLALSAAPSAAQDKGAASLSASDYLGTWRGVTDWRAVEGYDNPNGRWEFRTDGTFVDDANDTGPWSVGADGYINFSYPSGGGQARYTGTIVGDTLVGTMTTAAGDYSGAFAMRR